MVQEMVIQVYCGTGTGCSGMLWHRTWLFRCVVAQEMVVQCVVAQEMVVQVLWHSKRYCRFVMAQKTAT